MQNKENILNQKKIPQIFPPHQLKSRNRYPLKSIQSQQNHPDQNTSHQQIKTSINLNQSKLFNYNQKDLSLSLKQKYKLKHISLVHQLIASARNKKSQIQDLLRKQQNYAELQQLDQTQILNSLRKLKKVLRLMQIVCKIIIGKNQSNTLIDLSLQQSINIKQIHQQIISNYQHQLNIKICQINRLKKLVQILSLPQQDHQNNTSLCTHNSLSNSSSFIINNSNISFQLPNNKNHTSTQTQQCQIIHLSKKYQQNQIKNNRYQNKRFTNFIIHEQYSLWNILDAKQSQKQPHKQKQQVNQVEQSIMTQLAFSLKDPSLIPTQTRNSFLKRYKSIVKISINSLTLCNNIFIKCKQNKAILNISKQLDDISNYFNQYYHNQLGKYNENIDQFCKSVKDKISSLYDSIDKIYTKYINDKQALSFWNDSRIAF